MKNQNRGNLINENQILFRLSQVYSNEKDFNSVSQRLVSDPFEDKWTDKTVSVKKNRRKLKNSATKNVENAALTYLQVDGIH